MIGGRRRDMAIGPERNYSLSQAREAAMKLRLTLIQGLDPLEERKAAEVAGTTFAEAARTVHTARAAGWRNGKHMDQWLTTDRPSATWELGFREETVDDPTRCLRAIADAH